MYIFFTRLHCSVSRSVVSIYISHYISKYAGREAVVAQEYKHATVSALVWGFDNHSRKENIYNTQQASLQSSAKGGEWKYLNGEQSVFTLRFQVLSLTLPCAGYSVKLKKIINTYLSKSLFFLSHLPHITQIYRNKRIRRIRNYRCSTKKKNMA